MSTGLQGPRWLHYRIIRVNCTGIRNEDNVAMAKN